MGANSKIAKNTGFLYVRMLLAMGISFYTSRVVLEQLGVVNFGIYNVVGGVVSLFTFLNSAMASSTQRYLTVELGRGKFERLNLTFNTSLQIHILMAIIVVIITEILGLWFFYNKMQIPLERLNAAFWTFQFAIASMFVSFVNVPYTAIIIAYEKMSAFAYISIVEILLKLGVAYLLVISPIDKLIYYSMLMFVCPVIIRAIYGIYCNRHFAAVKICRVYDKALFKEMSIFAGWSLWGQIASVATTQGLNILLNMFFGPVINAARGIAVQVQAAVGQFSMNFQTAVNPQITKSYAINDFASMHSLIMRSAKFTYYLLLALTLPIVLEASAILSIWLVEVPEYTVAFLRIILMITIVDSVANPLMVAASATGKIKKYQSIIGGILICVLPLSYIILKFGASPISVFVVHLSICLISFFVRVYLIRKLIRLNVGKFITGVVCRIINTTLLSIVIPLCIYFFAPDTMLSMIIVILVSILSVCFSAYSVGLDLEEKKYVKSLWIKILS